MLLLGHAGSVEVCTRQLLGKPIRTSAEFREICPNIPYCGLFMCQEDAASKKWTPKPSPILPLTHGHNKKVNPFRLMYPSLS